MRIVRATASSSATCAAFRRLSQEPTHRAATVAVAVAVVALPLALAFGVSLGARRGQAGLVTAVVAGSLAAVSGGSNLQVSGPTGAMTVVLIPVVPRLKGALSLSDHAGADARSGAWSAAPVLRQTASSS